MAGRGCSGCSRGRGAPNPAQNPKQPHPSTPKGSPPPVSVPVTPAPPKIHIIPKATPKTAPSIKLPLPEEIDGEEDQTNTLWNFLMEVVTHKGLDSLGALLQDYYTDHVLEGIRDNGKWTTHIKDVNN